MSGDGGYPSMIRIWARALRPSQWTKNLVVLAAFIFAMGDPRQSVTIMDGWLVLWAAVCFCLLSSAVYLFNDVLDRDSDRCHPTKRLRPVASGELAPRAALRGAAILAALALGGAWAAGLPLLHVFVVYVILQYAYTLVLKRVALVDVFVIASGFVLRALGGAVVINVHISPWLLLCTLLLALFLALCKRRHEKVVLHDTASGARDSLQAYDVRLLDQAIAVVSAATIVSYALYTLWPDTVEKFGTNKLGFTIPFVLFGLFRYLDLVYRHEQGGEPERTLLTDPPLLINMALYGVVVLMVMFCP